MLHQHHQIQQEERVVDVVEDCKQTKKRYLDLKLNFFGKNKLK